MEHLQKLTHLMGISEGEEWEKRSRRNKTTDPEDSGACGDKILEKSTHRYHIFKLQKNEGKEKILNNARRRKYVMLHEKLQVKNYNLFHYIKKPSVTVEQNI